jgi:hypothetical protein
VTERRYALHNAGDGAYFLLGNDAEETAAGNVGTMFLVSRWEDGPHLGAERVAVRWTLSEAPLRTVESVLDNPFAGNPVTAVDWQYVGEFDTRRDAVNEAVTLSEARRTPTTTGAPR